MSGATGPFPPVRRRGVETLQANLGYRCNQACLHCHVEAGPARTEEMAPEVVEDLLQALAAWRVPVLDLTGGAPELHPRFRTLVARARALGAEVMDRCNLTILQEPGQEDLAAFLAGHRVHVVASLPCYLEENVDRQRGRGVHARSLAGLRALNALGYGRGDPALRLDLVYNPGGPALPPPQGALEAEYRRRLAPQGIAFDRLLTLANMPIARFRHALEAAGRLEAYQALLRGAHREANLEAVMCRTTLSVDWRGGLHDCDFNQQLGLPLLSGGRPRTTLRDLLDAPGRGLATLAGLPVQVADHCFGCTAGQGSSCTGALAGAGADAAGAVPAEAAAAGSP